MKHKLNEAKKKKDDEFYTPIEVIEKELQHYIHHFKGKVVYCNCDDYRWSNFVRFFRANFNLYGLSKLIATNYSGDNSLFEIKQEKSVYFEYSGGNACYVRDLKGNGDFRSYECIELLKQADIIVTNPPFSLFVEYFNKLIECNKKFLIIAPLVSLKYQSVFKQIKDGNVWLGISRSSGIKFTRPDNSIRAVPIRWLTNLDFPNKYKNLNPTKKYNPSLYPTYDNYNAIEVRRVKDIPIDYDGLMGVPTTFLDNYNPEQFELVSVKNDLKIANRELFTRIIIKHKRTNIHSKT